MDQANGMIVDSVDFALAVSANSKKTSRLWLCMEKPAIIDSVIGALAGFMQLEWLHLSSVTETLDRIVQHVVCNSRPDWRPVQERGFPLQWTVPQWFHLIFDVAPEFGIPSTSPVG